MIHFIYYLIFNNPMTEPELLQKLLVNLTKRDLINIIIKLLYTHQPHTIKEIINLFIE